MDTTALVTAILEAAKKKVKTKISPATEEGMKNNLVETSLVVSHKHGVGEVVSESDGTFVVEFQDGDKGIFDESTGGRWVTGGLDESSDALYRVDEAHEEGRAIKFNIGTKIGRGEDTLSMDDIKKAVEAHGFRVKRMRTKTRGKFEPTAIVSTRHKFSNKEVPGAVDSLSKALGQEAIATHHRGRGGLYGPEAAGWGGKFVKRFFTENNLDPTVIEGLNDADFDWIAESAIENYEAGMRSIFKDCENLTESQLLELSHEVLHRYVSKAIEDRDASRVAAQRAHGDAADHDRAAKKAHTAVGSHVHRMLADSDRKSAADQEHLADKRTKGIAKAKDKLKESDEMMNEDKLLELSKETLQRYATAAGHSAFKMRADAHWHDQRGEYHADKANDRDVDPVNRNLHYRAGREHDKKASELMGKVYDRDENVRKASDKIRDKQEAANRALARKDEMNGDKPLKEGQLNELSSHALADYVRKAHDNKDHAEGVRKAKSAMVNKALHRSHSDDDADDKVQESRLLSLAEALISRLDELSTDTLGSYTKKAVKDKEQHDVQATRNLDLARQSAGETKDKAIARAEKEHAKSAHRGDGISTAIAKIINRQESK